MSFSNPILAGEELVRSAIRSEDYVAGTSGWRIARDGDAEFNSIVARGSIESVGATTTAQLSAGSLIIELNANPVTLSRLTIRTLEFQDGNTNKKGNLVFMDEAPHPRIGFTAPISTSRGAMFDGATGFWYATSGFSDANETWQNLPLQGGWANDPGNEAKYRLDADGSVYIRGRIAGGAAPGVFATLPAGYRPAIIHGVGTINPATLSNQQVIVATNGQMSIFNVGASNWIDLGGIAPFKVAGVL